MYTRDTKRAFCLSILLVMLIHTGQLDWGLEQGIYGVAIYYFLLSDGLVVMI